ncbi:hypothetical protein VTK73DRAFT_9823 [Phialemonium thermophilum]|uniref:Uncharacterized protein n=1 Tax=Phialemonium thermophilum TaxID=223376 RepID=A0ABR3XIH7_9PEZI
MDGKLVNGHTAKIGVHYRDEALLHRSATTQEVVESEPAVHCLTELTRVIQSSPAPSLQARMTSEGSAPRSLGRAKKIQSWFHMTSLSGVGVTAAPERDTNMRRHWRGTP